MHINAKKNGLKCVCMFELFYRLSNLMQDCSKFYWRSAGRIKSVKNRWQTKNFLSQHGFEKNIVKYNDQANRFGRSRQRHRHDQAVTYPWRAVQNRQRHHEHLHNLLQHPPLMNESAAFLFMVEKQYKTVPPLSGRHGWHVCGFFAVKDLKNTQGHHGVGRSQNPPISAPAGTSIWTRRGSTGPAQSAGEPLGRFSLGLKSLPPMRWIFIS